MKMFIYVQDNHDILFYLLVDIYYPIISRRGFWFDHPLAQRICGFGRVFYCSPMKWTQNDFSVNEMLGLMLPAFELDERNYIWNVSNMMLQKHQQIHMYLHATLYSHQNVVCCSSVVPVSSVTIHMRIRRRSRLRKYILPNVFWYKNHITNPNRGGFLYSQPSLATASSVKERDSIAFLWV